MPSPKYYVCPNAIGQLFGTKKCDYYVGARHRQIIGKVENVDIAVPRHRQIIGELENVDKAVHRPHAIAKISCLSKCDRASCYVG